MKNLGQGAAPKPQSVDDLPPEAKSDFQKAKEMKDKAADDYKAKNFDGASEKYYQIINIIREND